MESHQIPNIVPVAFATTGTPHTLHFAKCDFCSLARAKMC